ncbi:MAG: ATP-binding protein [Gemmatimonadota bacterium]
MVSIPVKAAPPAGGQLFSRSDLLRWLYVGRLTVVSGILAGALLARPDELPLVVVMFLVALGVTAGSFWHTHVVGRAPGVNFLYAQVILDVVLVTLIIHVTGGPESSFAPLYILVVSSGALLLPLPGGVLIGGLASVLYSADLVWGFQDSIRMMVGLQIGLFALVAVITGVVGDRLRRTGIALGAVESELRQLRLDTGDILANLATGVLTVDGQGRLAYANPAAEALLGLSVEEWMGRPVVDEVEGRAPELGGVLRRALREGRRVERFRASLMREGKEVQLGVSTAVLERGDREPPSATAIFQDITDLERLDALNRRAERLEAVAALSASLAHEIKNPLASIRSAVEQLTRPGLEADDRSVLQQLVLKESDRLSRLLSEFLDYSGLRLAARRTVSLAGVVRDAVTLVRQHPEAEGVALVCEGLDGDGWVEGDPDLLHRAVFNLLLNGVQFSGRDGRVVARLSGGQPRSRRTGIEHPVSLTVVDSGPGVDSELQEWIFDPFFTTRPGGSGLGLAVVHRAVEAHAGAVYVDRAPEGGAMFTMVLPSVDGPQPEDGP